MQIRTQVGGRGRWLTSSLVVLSLLLAACGGGESDGEPTAGDDAGTEIDGEEPAERHELTMGMAHSGLWTAEWFGWLAAQELGYFDELGLDIEFITTGGSGSAVEQLLGGNLDVANPSSSAVAEAVISGQDLVAFYTYSTGAIFGVFAVEDTGITEISGLGGANIGITEPGGGEVPFLEAALRNAGLDPISDVTLIPIGEGGADTFQAIDSGQVEAYAAAYNDVFALRTVGDVSLNDLTPPEFEGFPGRWMVTTPETFEEKSEALGLLAKGTSMGLHFCINNWDACEEMLREAVPEIWEEGPGGLSQGGQRFELAQEHVPPEDESSYGAFDREATERFFATIAGEEGQDAIPDLDEFLNESLLDTANDFDRERVEEDATNYAN